MTAPRRSIRIGILGAESTHAAAFAALFNRRRAAPGCRVVAIWGETPALARKAAAEGSVPRVVRSPREMLGEVDALIVCHRHPDPHVPAARPFAERGVPVFIGKPFCRLAAEGRSLLKGRGAIASYGALTLQRSFLAFRKALPKVGKVQAGTVSGPCDLDSPYAGIWFYGIHLVEMALSAFGTDIAWARAERNGRNAAGLLGYPDGRIVTLNFLRDAGNFSISAVGVRGELHREIRFDRSPYLSSVRRMARMFRTGKGPMSEEELLRPVEVLRTLERSLGRNAR